MESAGKDPATMANEIVKRLELVEQRLSALGYGAAPAGLTQPDPGATEQWNGAQVWAHMAEFVPYWQQQLANVIAQYSGSPVPFGRTKEDAARVDAIEVGKNVPIPNMIEQVQQAIALTKDYLKTMTPEQWAAIGQHARRGEMTAPQIVQTFTLDHLEEHADQLEALV
ncbi:MAG: DinB family protein [Candidatus Limnocylindrales bacterium]